MTVLVTVLGAYLAWDNFNRGNFGLGQFRFVIRTRIFRCLIICFSTFECTHSSTFLNYIYHIGCNLGSSESVHCMSSETSFSESV